MKKMSSSTAIMTILSIIMIMAAPEAMTQTSRVDRLVERDTTERLEDIQSLKHSLRELRLQIQVLDTALIEAKKKPSNKRYYLDGRKIADAVTALTIFGGAIAAYKFQDKAHVLRVASLIGGVSTSVSVLLGLAADLTSDEAETIQDKIRDLNRLMAATTVNLNREVKILCKTEPSNQMCK